MGMREKEWEKGEKKRGKEDEKVLIFVFFFFFHNKSRAILYLEYQKDSEKQNK